MMASLTHPTVSKQTPLTRLNTAHGEHFAEFFLELDDRLFAEGLVESGPLLPQIAALERHKYHIGLNRAAKQIYTNFVTIAHHIVGCGKPHGISAGLANSVLGQDFLRLLRFHN